MRDRTGCDRAGTRFCEAGKGPDAARATAATLRGAARAAGRLRWRAAVPGAVRALSRPALPLLLLDRPQRGRRAGRAAVDLHPGAGRAAGRQAERPVASVA